MKRTYHRTKPSLADNTIQPYVPLVKSMKISISTNYPGLLDELTQLSIENSCSLDAQIETALVCYVKAVRAGTDILQVPQAAMRKHTKPKKA